MPAQVFKEPTLTDNFVSSFLVILTLAIIAASGFVVLENYGILVYFMIIIFSIFSLVLWHSSTRGYICSHCAHVFKISFWKDLPTTSSILIKKKFLECPKCDIRDYHSELVIKKKSY